MPTLMLRLVMLKEMRMSPASKEDLGMTVVGIDPGKEGAVVLLLPDPTPPLVWAMPTTTKRVGKTNRTCIDGYGLADICREVKKYKPKHIVVEHLWSRPTDTPMTAWSLGGGFERCLQAIESCKLSYTLVAPVRWKGVAMGDKSYWKGDKQASVRYIQEQYPAWPLKVGRQRKDQDGIADAYCLALYARRML